MSSSRDVQNVTPRLFIAATRQNDGKTTSSLGLCAALQNSFPGIGFIKPVGQRFVRVEEQKIDEDIVLMDQVYHLNCPLVDMSPIAVEPDFTRRYLNSSRKDHLVQRIVKAFDRVAWEKDFVVCEGTGHAGVGSVFDLSNARVAKILKAKVILVTRGGIGKPIDEVALNRALFEREGVEIIGVIINKVLPQKIETVTEFATKGLRRQGLELLGVMPHVPVLESPSVESIQRELDAEHLNLPANTHSLVRKIILAATSAQRSMDFLADGVLLVTPADRNDILGSLEIRVRNGQCPSLAGVVLTGEDQPGDTTRNVARQLPFPVLFANDNSYSIASRIHDLTVKTQPYDTEKISLIRDMFRRHIDVQKILDALSE